MNKTLAVLTSGGDAPGMNAAIRAIVRRALDRKLKVYGVYNGYEGLVQGGEAIRLLAWKDVGGILQAGGTFLGTARCERFKDREGRQQAVLHLLQNGVEALIVIGGDGSLTGAHVLATEWPEHVAGIREQHPELALDQDAGSPLQVIGLPGSIDNDLYGTDMSIGADTALNHILRAMDNLSSTAASHQRTFVVETMGRHCGYLALMATLAGGASWVMVPEEELELRWHQKMVEAIDKARQIGRHHQMVIVAEGARHADGLPIHSDEVRALLSRRLGIDVRLTVLGHVQRGGAPTAFDRILATRLGAAAVDRLLRPSATDHHHMLGLARNTVQPTPLAEVLEKSKAVRAEIEKSNYSKALELRGESFRQTLELVRTLTRITPAQEHSAEGGVAVLTAGADAPGMNAVVSVAARCLLNQGVPVYGTLNGFAGLIQDQFRELDWHELVAWVNRPSSEIGTARTHVDLDPEKITQIAQNLKKRNLKGLIVIGGWDTYLKIQQLLQARKDFQALQIPIIVVPASIDNNLPCTAFSVGTDTALNNIVDAVDKIGHTAGATSRTFIVEVMGRQCGFLALMGALASGAEKAYLPETGVNLAKLNRDVEIFKNSFAFGKRMIICLCNEHCSRRYTTDFIHRVFEEESAGEFEVRTAILGHLQRGGVPTAFDRILASRMGAKAAFSILDAMKNSKDDVLTLGLRGRGITAIAFKEAFDEMDIKHERPKNQWFMKLVEVAGALAKHAPGDPMAEKA